MTTIRRGFRDRAVAVAYVDGVDPVTRRPVRTPTYPLGTRPIPCRIVHRGDRSVVRDPDNPTRVLIDSDVLVGPEHADALALGVELHTTDGRRYVVAGGIVELGRLAGDAVYGRVPLQRTARGVAPDLPPEPDGDAT